MAIFAAWRKQWLNPRVLTLCAVGLLVFDLWSYGSKSARPADEAHEPHWDLVAAFMQDKRDYRISPADYQFFEHNGALAYHLRSDYGYDPIVLARYQALHDAAPNYFDRVYDLLNVRYVLARAALDWHNGPELPVSTEREGLWIYRRPTALGRAFIAHDAQIIADDAQARAALRAPAFSISRTVTLPAAPPCSLEATQPQEETAQVVDESPNHIELRTRSAGAGLLVLSETYYPGWEARVDGQPAPVLRADTVLRAVCLPAGEHTVRFDFRPPDLIVGAIISCLALAVVVVVAGAEFLRRP
jgi:hypothetical protein